MVDGGSADATAELARPLCDQLLESPPGRALQMNRGAAAAGGDYLFFLHADTVPGISWQQLQQILGAAPAWGFAPVRLSGRQPLLRLVERSMNLRSRLTRVATGDLMQFVRRDVFVNSGGYNHIPLMEDVEFSTRLRRLGPPLVLPVPVTSSSRRWEQGGILRTIVRMWGLRLAWFAGVSPHRLYRHYYGAGPACDRADAPR